MSRSALRVPEYCFPRARAYRKSSLSAGHTCRAITPSRINRRDYENSPLLISLRDSSRSQTARRVFTFGTDRSRARRVRRRWMPQTRFFAPSSRSEFFSEIYTFIGRRIYHSSVARLGLSSRRRERFEKVWEIWGEEYKTVCAEVLPRGMELFFHWFWNECRKVAILNIHLSWIYHAEYIIYHYFNATRRKKFDRIKLKINEPNACWLKGTEFLVLRAEFGLRESEILASFDQKLIQYIYLCKFPGKSWQAIKRDRHAIVQPLIIAQKCNVYLVFLLLLETT